MRRPSRHHRGFTLLEVMIASAIGVAVLAVGLVAGMQMQRRAVLEEQTMLAQVTGRAVKDLLAKDLQRAGLGMGNAPITFDNGDRRFAIQSWHEPDLTAGVAPAFPADATFSLPPAPYDDMKSDVLRLYWGDTRSMVVMAGCSQNGTGRMVTGNNGQSANFCTAPNPPLGMNPPSGGPDTPAILVNPTLNVACHIMIHGINDNSLHINANPGSGGNNNTPDPRCAPGSNVWDSSKNWMTMRTLSAAYRVNWRGGSPALEYLAPGATTWVVVSRGVERMKVRHAVIDLTAPNQPYRWFPDAAAGNPTIDACTRTNGQCAVNVLPDETDATDEERRNLLRQRVREVEVTLTIRTRRADRDIMDPAAGDDEEGFPRDGFKRRTFSFRVAPRNFAAAGQQAPTDT